MAPVIGLHRLAGRHRPPGIRPLTDGFETELVKAAKLGQVAVVVGSFRHVEDFQMAGVRTSIFKRPRPLPHHRRAAAHGSTSYIFIREEPD